MGKRIGFWNPSEIEYFDYTLVSHEEYELCELFLPKNLAKKCKIVKFQKSVQENKEIFAWYLSSINERENFVLDVNFLNSASGHIICLLKEFIQAFNSLDTESCKRLQRSFLKINFQSYYLYKTNWLVDELTMFAEILRETIFSTSPLRFESETDYRLWWERPLAMQQFIDKFQESCDFQNLKSFQSLECINTIYENLLSAVGDWEELRGFEKLEASSGYFLVLAEHWFRTENYQLSLLCIHRSVDCILHLLGSREGVVVPDRRSMKLKDDRGKFTGYYDIFKALRDRRDRAFGDSERFIIKLNNYRNSLREVHGFRVVDRQEVYEFLGLCRIFLESLQPEVNSYFYKERFDVQLKLSLKVIFEIEAGIDSYLSGI